MIRSRYLVKSIGSIRLLVQLGQKVARTGFLAVENVFVDVLLGTVFINMNIKSIYSKCGVVIPTRSCPVALETKSNATAQENSVDFSENVVDIKQVPLQ